MAPAEIEGVIYELLAESRGTTAAEVHADVGAGGDIDSLEGVELVVAAEARFGVQITDQELTAGACRSIPQLARLVAAKTTASAPHVEDARGRIRP